MRVEIIISHKCIKRAFSLHKKFSREVDVFEGGYALGRMVVIDALMSLVRSTSAATYGPCGSGK